MAVPIQTAPEDGGGGSPGGGGDSSPSTPPPAPPAQGSVLGVVVTGSSTTFTADQINAAGGPWASFKVRVTPLNKAGAGPAAEAAYPS